MSVETAYLLPFWVLALAQDRGHIQDHHYWSNGIWFPISIVEAKCETVAVYNVEQVNN